MTPRVIMQALITVCAALFAASASAAIAPCPSPCECFATDNGIKVANCTDLPDKTTEKEWAQQILRVRFESGRASPVVFKVEAFNAFPRLTYLDVAGGTVQHVNSDAFGGLPELLELNLVGTDIKKLHPHTFAGNRKLAFLSLKKNRRLSVGPSFLVSQSIAELDLSECALKSLKSVYFKGLPNLKYLFAARNELVVLGPQFGPPGLKYADLAHNRIERVRDDLEAYKRLRTVDLTGNPINCTCELAEVDKRLTSRGVAFGDTVECENTGKPLGDMAEACGSDAVMMGDEPADMYQADGLLKIDQKALQSMEDTDDFGGSGSGSGDDELMLVSTERKSSASEKIDGTSKNNTKLDVSTEAPSSVRPSSTESPPAATETVPPTARAVTVAAIPSAAGDADGGGGVGALPPIVQTASADGGNSSGEIVSKKIQAPEDDGQEDDLRAQVTDYLKSNVGITGTAALLAAVIVAIVYKAACAGRSRSHDIRDGADAKEVELREIKYVAANTEEQRGGGGGGGDDSPTASGGSAAEEDSNLLDEEDRLSDYDDNESGDQPPSAAAAAPSKDAVKAGNPSPGGSPDVPTRVIVKLTETPRVSKPITINNVH